MPHVIINRIKCCQGFRCDKIYIFWGHFNADKITQQNEEHTITRKVQKTQQNSTPPCRNRTRPRCRAVSELTCKKMSKAGFFEDKSVIEIFMRSFVKVARWRKRGDCHRTLNMLKSLPVPSRRNALVQC